MNYYIITGSSKGLGKALTELLLNDENNIVYGVARNCTITHKNYHHINADFSKTADILSFECPELEKPARIVLINNAGIVGDINHIGNVDEQSIVDCYTVNLIAPSVLINKFLKDYHQIEDKLIINISSGAGKSAIDGWSSYCATKSGLDMFSNVVNEEFQLDNSTTKILSLAPGIIDTGMQDQIRTASKEGFSNIERFKSYKKEGDLASAELTAEKVLRFIKEPEIANDVLCSVRDL